MSARAEQIMRAACEHRGDQDLDDRVAVVRDSFAKVEAGDPVAHVTEPAVLKALDAITGRRHTNDGRPSVNTAGELDRVIECMADNLASVALDEATIFRSGGYVTLDGPASAERMAVELCRVQHFTKPGKDGDVTTHPSRELVARFISIVDPRVPELLGRWAAPLLRPDGSVECARGYDPDSRLWIEGWDGPIPGTTRQDAYEAAVRLFGHVNAGQWAEPIDAAAFLAHAVTVAARPAIAGCVPAWVYSSSATGSGKTSLARWAGKVGGLCDAWTDPGMVEDDELARKLDTFASRPAVVLDNLRGVVRSALLEATITGGTLPVRRLYVGPVVVPWRAVLSITSNGAEVGRDWLRRTLPVRLGPARLNAGRDLLAEVTPQMTADAVTIARAWLLSGERSTATSLASFAEWSGVVAGALAWIGAGDIVAGTRQAVEDLAATDDDDAGLLDAVETWIVARGAAEFTAGELWDAAHAFGTRAATELGQALAEVQSAKALGRRLGRLHDGTRAMQSRRIQGRRYWRIAHR